MCIRDRGESNKFANAAALAVAQSPGHSYNPLFLYGGVGLGKTHLMHAIGNHIKKENPEAQIVYVTSETFMNELIRMIQLTNNNANIDLREQFRNKYRNVDVLLVDDIQFIAGKDVTQDEFFHTFNALHELNKQIVISSDRPPKEMEKLEERMRSRFEWGLIADIKMPDYETRVAILLKKMQVLKEQNPDILPIKNEVFHYIAQQKDASIRTLEGEMCIRDRPCPHAYITSGSFRKTQITSKSASVSFLKPSRSDSTMYSICLLYTSKYCVYTDGPYPFALVPYSEWAGTGKYVPVPPFHVRSPCLLYTSRCV